MATAYPVLFAQPLQALPAWVPSLAFAAVFTAVFWGVAKAWERAGWRLTI